MTYRLQRRDQTAYAGNRKNGVKIELLNMQKKKKTCTASYYNIPFPL